MRSMIKLMRSHKFITKGMTIFLAGYKIIDLVYESSNSLVYRGIQTESNLPVILKFLNPDYPSTEELTRYKQEYVITRNLKIDNAIVAYDLVKYQNTLVIIFEDFGGRSLDLLLKEHQFSIREFLEIAIKITLGLQEIHRENIIHKDINPANIVYNPTTKEVKIIDFGIATVLPKENPTLKNPQILEGTLAYISPEQTGRVNLALDYRTDFYSLGVTFYELLANQKPFLKDDLLELLYCHLAEIPKSPAESNAKISLILSDIVMKLMAKNPDERYQTTWGIKADLEACLQQLENSKTVNNFQLASQDISDRFQISQKLYGREKEIERLLKIFARARNGENNTSATILISGYSGIGKSALIKEIYRSITAAKGYFIEGKFDQYQKDIPYSAIVQAFSNLIEYLLVETEASLQQWREKLLAVLGINIGVIIEVIPKLELIVSQVNEIPTLPPKEAENRFNIVFKNFVKIFARKEHPLVIFLDDLQWVDRPSLRLIELIIKELENDCLVLIGAYRDNEVTPIHPLMTTINEIEKAGVKIEQISLAPLGLLDINNLIKDSFKSSPEATDRLGELILAKTNGNPFFINQFLRSLQQENLLYFNCLERNWQWDLAEIKKRDITENVVELLLRSIKKLSREVQKVLQLAACIGDRFEIETLAIISQKEPQETALILREAIAAGLIFPLSDAYKAIELGIREDREQIAIEYKFIHDRVQQAAYSLISPEKKPILHWEIGQLLLANIPEKERENKIFALVNQLNLGRELIETQQQKDRLAKLNLIAAKKAKRSAAYQTVFNYLEIAKSLLDRDSWKRIYNLSLEIYIEAAEAAYLSGNFSAMEELAEEVLEKGGNLLDKVKVYEIKIQACIAQNKLVEALKIAIQVLKLLGINLPENPTKLDIIVGLLQTKLILAGKKIESLIDLPLMTDPYKLAAMRILYRLSAISYVLNPKLFSLIVFKLINLSFKYGNCSFSSLGYAGYGVILCGFRNDIDSGYQFGKIALQLLELLNAIEMKTIVLTIVNLFIIHWKEHIRITLEPFLKAYSTGIEAGDIQYADLALIQYFINSYSSGKYLPEIEREIDLYKDIIYKSKTIILWWKFLQLYISNLQKESDYFALEAQDIIKELKNKNQRSPLFRLNTYLSKFYYLFYCYNRAVKYSNLAERYLSNGNGLTVVPEFYFYSSLILVTRYSLLNQSEQKQILSKIKNNQKKMKKWAHHAPMNHLHKYYLVEAERYRILGKKWAAIEYYDRAIASAKENEFIQEEALANELAGRFYLAENKAKIAEIYLKDALYCYQKWGAIAKVNALEKQYPQFFSKKSQKKPLKVTDTSGSSSNKITSEDIDLATIIKTSRSLSRETELEKLLEIILKFTIENVGAKTGIIFLERAENHFVKAEIEADRENPVLLCNLNLEQSDFFPISVINYVRRTQENIILQNASSESIFSKDPYIIKRQIKSILCLPLLGKGKLVGIIYLENNLIVAAFNEERLEILKLISAQAAISIENALLRNKQIDRSDLYQVGGCLTVNSPSYVVRQADRDLYSALKRGDFCYIFNARQMGKSSLRVQISQRLETEGFVCVAVDLTAIGNYNISLEQWYFGLIDELVYQLNLSQSFDCESWWESLEKFSPVQKLNKFFREIVLQKIKNKIVIFIDEIDSISSLDFNMDDFFALIRSLYNQRADRPEYQRLTFVLLGVATPSQLIKNKDRTPFNLGRGIALAGFKINEIEPLTIGLASKYSQTKTLLEAILAWTGGQPFLTQKLCNLILNSDSKIRPEQETEFVEQVVREKIIENWELQDEPQHLRTISDRILSKQSADFPLLQLYQQILERGEIPCHNSPETTELLLSGLVSQHQGKLKIYNQIYRVIFNANWVAEIID